VTVSGDPDDGDVVVATRLARRLGRTMLAEFRALRVGLILVDQLPSQMAPRVIKTTGAKLALRQVDPEDRQALASTMLFGDLEYDEIARLIPGQAHLYAEGYHRAHRLRTPHLESFLNLPAPPTDEKLADMISSEAWFQNAQLRRIDDLLDRFSIAMDHFDARRTETCQVLKSLICKETEIVRKHADSPVTKDHHHLADQFAQVGVELNAAYRSLARGLYREVSAVRVPGGASGDRIESKRRRQLQRFRDGIEIRSEHLRAFIHRKVAKHRKAV